MGYTPRLTVRYMGSSKTLKSKTPLATDLARACNYDLLLGKSACGHQERVWTVEGLIVRINTGFADPLHWPLPLERYSQTPAIHKC